MNTTTPPAAGSFRILSGMRGGSDFESCARYQTLLIIPRDAIPKDLIPTDQDWAHEIVASLPRPQGDGIGAFCRCIPESR